jgi:hypothetical protein
MRKIVNLLKQTIVEQLWLIALLTPLVVLAILGVITYTKHKNAVFSVEKRILVSDVQLSRSEIAKMVTKPLNELMSIKVYFDDQSSLDNALIASLSDQEIIHRDSAGAILQNLPRRNRVAMLTYVSSRRIKKNQTVAGLG